MADFLADAFFVLLSFGFLAAYGMHLDRKAERRREKTREEERLRQATMLEAGRNFTAGYVAGKKAAEKKAAIQQPTDDL